MQHQSRQRGQMARLDQHEHSGRVGLSDEGGELGDGQGGRGGGVWGKFGEED